MAVESNKIVVWERCNKLGKWIPYSANICQVLEENHRKKDMVCLGDVDEELKIYSVNFKDMFQVSEATGMTVFSARVPLL